MLTENRLREGYPEPHCTVTYGQPVLFAWDGSVLSFQAVTLQRSSFVEYLLGTLIPSLILYHIGK